jgi:hypothetical protein
MQKIYTKQRRTFEIAIANHCFIASWENVFKKRLWQLRQIREMMKQ